MNGGAGIRHRWTEKPDWFVREELAPGIHRITEPGYRADYRCNIYLIQGTRFDVVIDTGLGLGSLRAFLHPMAPDPVLVSSHSHYDHIGSNFEFSRRLIHPAEASIVAAPDHVKTYADLLLATEDFYSLPWDRFQAADWVVEPAAATGFLDEGDVLDLGSHVFSILHTPGHSWGGLCLWEEATGSMFCADTVYQGELFDALPCSDIPTYVETMKRLKHYPVRIAYPGHGPVLSGTEFHAIIDDYIKQKAAN